MIKSFQDLIEMAKKSGSKCKVAVIWPDDPHTMEAVHDAWKQELILPVFYGKPQNIEKYWNAEYAGEAMPEVIRCDSAQDSVELAIKHVREGVIGCLMKGTVETAVLMKAVVNKEQGIRASDTLSVLGMVESPYYHKLFAVTDCGLLMYPTLEQKQAALCNAVKVFHSLGNQCPEVSVLAAVEHVNPKMPESVEAGKLKEHWQNGEIAGCIVEGPISYDLSMDAEAAQIKGYSSPVCGETDILVVPDIASGNLLIKSLMFTGGARVAGIVCGAQVPIILNSRAASSEDKYLSILLSAAIYTGSSAKQ